MSIIAYMVSFFFVQFYLGPKNVATAQATLVESLDSSTEIANSIEEDEGYFIQDRTVERLHALHHFVDDRISKLLSMDQNLPFVKLLKGICPEMLVQEPVKGLKFQCHALKTNDCFCFSHKKATWYRAAAFCRQFAMTLAYPFQGNHEVALWVRNKVYDPSVVAKRGDAYWTSAIDRFIPGEMIWMNTGHRLDQPDKNNSSASEIESCLKLSIPNPPNTTNGKEEKLPLNYIFSSCFDENYFICHKFLNFFPLQTANA
ncbi:uncharacterized protein LOC130688681 isoform X1 [Daphnia carinata]|uniref:uncharacterized protein LOC130688681 isoform X1 n=1 Tax=Daphnia carinata TaxID=120202 RepID=UPI00286957AB|nr:uncharacterized protein LOC130688681 isoform X1 [Daphnia carinata]